MTTNPLPAHSTHTVPHPASGIHFLYFSDGDKAIHMLSRDDLVQKPVLDRSYKVDGVALGPQTPTPYILVSDIAPIQLHTLNLATHSRFTTQALFILTLSEDQIKLNDIQYAIRGGRVVRHQPPVATRPLDGDVVREEVR